VGGGGALVNSRLSTWYWVSYHEQVDESQVALPVFSLRQLPTRPSTFHQRLKWHEVLSSTMPWDLSFSRTVSHNNPLYKFPASDILL
jgi:hypothetical protein